MSYSTPASSRAHQWLHTALLRRWDERKSQRPSMSSMSRFAPHGGSGGAVSGGAYQLTCDHHFSSCLTGAVLICHPSSETSSGCSYFLPSIDRLITCTPDPHRRAPPHPTSKPGLRVRTLHRHPRSRGALINLLVPSTWSSTRVNGANIIFVVWKPRKRR